MPTGNDYFALLDSEGGGALLLSEYRRVIHFDGMGGSDNDLAAVFEAFKAASACDEWVVLAADYRLGACFEPAIAQPHERPRLRGWVFGQARCLDAKAVSTFLDERLSRVPESERIAGVAELSSAMDFASYEQKVEQIRNWIADGDCYQINLTFSLDLRIYGHPLALYARLRQRQPVRYGGYVAIPEETLLSFSPELFFERIGDRIVTRPMKGTAPRGATLEEDETNRIALLASEKERAENIMIVDLLRNDLGKLAKPGKVWVEALCEAEAYPTLWQVTSTISADLSGARLFDLFRALFPCGSIIGAPKIRAMQRIAELEALPRGLYTGALGWLAPDGDCRFSVAIRTLEVGAEGRAKLGVGSGVVIDADPVREYAECLLKSDFLTGFDPGFELFETMRLASGAIPFLAYHLERIEASAKALGFAFDPSAICNALAAYVNERGNGSYRLRLSLSHNGGWEIISSELQEKELLPRHAVIADERLDADDYLLRHKTTARDRYDRVLARLSGRFDIFDAIFLNTRGDVCEGARSNVFVERNGVLLTPPLTCGLLPGVMRRHLIESGRAVECVLTEGDLLGASAIFMANAVRGLVRVSLET